PGPEALRRVLRLLGRLFRRPEGEHRKDRPEDLLLRDSVALGDVREEGRDEPVAALGKPALRLVDLRTLRLPARDELADLLELRARVDGTHVRVLVERVADAQRREPALELLEQRLADGLLHEEPRAGAADGA